MSQPVVLPRPRAVLAALLLALACLGASSAVAQAVVPASVVRTPPTAQYPTGYERFNYTPKVDGGPTKPGFVGFYSDDDRAGMRTQITNVIGIDNPAGQVKDIKVEAPAGQLAAIANADICPIEQYRADQCPQSSLVADTTALANIMDPITGALGAQVATNGSVYSLEPPPNSRITARLGIVLRAPGQPVFQFLDVRVRDEGDYGLEFNLKGLANSVLGLPIAIVSLRFTFVDKISNGKYFTENPTSCDRFPASANANSYKTPAIFGDAFTSFQATDCKNVPADPQINFSTADERPLTTSPYTVEQTQPETMIAPDGTSRSPANFKAVKVTLPAGTGLNPASAVGREICTAAQFGPKGESDSCPPGSVIGDVAFASPPVGVLVGNAYQGEQDADGNINVYITAKAKGVITKLKLKTVPDRRTGQVVNYFTDLPLVPVTSFKFVFRGGDRSVLTTGPGCGTRTGEAVITPYSGNPDNTRNGGFDLKPDADGSCSTDKASISTSLKNATRAAGADSNVDVTITRPDRGGLLQSVRNVLPEGLLGRLPLVPRCPDAVAATTGNCPDSSRIGNATVLSGVGGAPASVPGPVYLGGPINGSVASLVIVADAIVGPINAGRVIVRAPLTTDPRTARLIVDAAVPQITGGINTYIQQLDIDINRPGFAFNATGCDTRTLDVTAQTTTGGTATSSSPYAATGCGRLPFTPGIAVTIDSTGIVPAGTRVPVTANLTQPEGQTNLRLAGVRLPTTLRPDVLAIDRTCQRRQLDANACPSRSVVGTAIATTPALEAPLSGPVRLAQTGVYPPKLSGVAAPWIVTSLSGQTALRLDGSNRLPPQGGLEATFSAVPDVPVDAFKLNFPGGPTGIFQLRDQLCERPLGDASVAFRSQDGRVIQTSAPVDAPACAGRPTLRAAIRGSAVKQPAVTLDVTAGTVKSKAKPVQRVRATLPSQLTLTGRGRARVTVAKAIVSTKRGKKLVRKAVAVKYRTRKLSARSLEVLVPKGTTAVRVVLDRGAVKLSKRGQTALAKRRSMVVETVAAATERGGRKTKLSADLRAKR